MINFAFCSVSISPVRSEPKDQAEIVTQLLFGEVVKILEFSEPWCKVETETDQYTGFIDVKHAVSLSDNEAIKWIEEQAIVPQREIEILSPTGVQRVCRGSMLSSQNATFSLGGLEYARKDELINFFNDACEIAEDYTNTPYLWGGKSPFGIDCSGLTQICFQVFGVKLPRDAYQQAEVGSEVSFENHQRNDLAFFSNTSGKIIHVGILNEKGQIIHAAGQVRVDTFTNEGIIHSTTGKLTHKLTKINRL